MPPRGPFVFSDQTGWPFFFNVRTVDLFCHKAKCGAATAVSWLMDVAVRLVKGIQGTINSFRFAM